MATRAAVAWSLTGQVTSYICSFISSVAVARLLSPSEIGIFAFSLAAMGILSTFAAFNMSAFVVRDPAYGAEKLDAAFMVNCTMGLILSGATYALGAVSWHLYEASDIARVLQVLAWCPLISTLEFRPATMLQLDIDFRTLSGVNTFKSLFGSATTVVLAAHGYGCLSMAYGWLAAATCSAITLNIVGHRHAGFGLSLKGSRKALVFGLTMTTVSGVSSIAARLSDLVLSHFLGLAALGVYSRATNISSIIFENVYGAVTRVTFVQMSASLKTTGQLDIVFMSTFRMLLAVFWPMLIGLAVLSRPIVYILYGDRWLGAAAPLSALMVAQFIVLSFGMNWELFVLRDQISKQTRIEIGRAVFGTLAFAAGSMVSITAASIGRIVEAVFGFVQYAPHVSRLSGIAPDELLRCFREALLLTLAAVLPSLFLMLTTRWSYTVHPLFILGAIGSGVFLWFALLIRQKHPLFHGLCSIARQLRHADLTRAPVP